MSLKAFHIVFIAVSTLLMLGVGGWGVVDYRRSGSSASLIIGVGCLVLAAVLLVYGRYFLKKLQRISYL